MTRNEAILSHPCQPLSQDSARAHNIAVPICKQVAFQPLALGIEFGQARLGIRQRPAIAQLAQQKGFVSHQARQPAACRGR